MTAWLPFVIAAGCVVVVARIWGQWRAGIRADFVRQYTLPRGIFDKLRAKHPDLSTKDCQLVTQALRQFFLAYLKGGFKSVSMPSQIADDLWHELILYTKVYERFCSKAFGRFMHHTPAAVLGSVAAQDEGLRRCWRLVCQEEGINPKKPTRVPLLFAVDGKLNIPGGFRYVADCNRLGRTDKDGRPVHCGGDIAASCGSGDGGMFDGFGSSSCSGDSGCSGGGCGGGD
jgi:hypothetical protein